MPLEPDKNATPDTHRYCTEVNCSLKLLNANSPKITYPFPYQETV